MSAPNPIKPVSLTLIGPGFTVFQELAVHIRNGYVPHPSIAAEFYQNGNVSVICVLGNPTQYSIDAARESEELALAQQEADYQKAVQAEAKRIVDQEKRDALAAKVEAMRVQAAKDIAAFEAQHHKDMAALEAKAAAAIAAVA